MHVSPALSQKFYWVGQKMRGRGPIQDRLNWLEETQWYSADKLKTLQFEKLKATITHAYHTVPYYRKICDEHGLNPSSFHSFNDLQKLPLLTRDKLRTYQDSLVSSEADFKTLQNNFSSGSTGVRAEFKQDLNFRLWMRAHQLRTYQWCNEWKLGDPFVLLWGSEIYWSYKRLVDNIENLLTNRRELNTFQLSNDVIKSFLNQLMKFKPHLVSTYTNAMHLIAMEAEASGLQIEGLRAIQATSEPVPTSIRERMANIFNCEIYDKYGMRESNIIAHESPNHEAMCIQMENVYVEFLNSDNQPCKPNETGRIVVTTLNNLSMPLIRYETSDLATPIEGYCSSGMNFERMSSVTGRLQDLIVTPTGIHIDAYFFSYLIMRFKEIHWFQVEQTELERLYIRLYVPLGFAEHSRRELVERIHHHTGYPFIIDFEFLQHMPQSSTGKFRLCVSNIKTS